MLGYMTKDQAKQHGFTHHASYYGIPCWMKDPEREDPMVATKWAPLELAMSLFHYIEGFVSAIIWPDAEPAFMFKLWGKIE